MPTRNLPVQAGRRFVTYVGEAPDVNVATLIANDKLELVGVFTNQVADYVGYVASMFVS